MRYVFFVLAAWIFPVVLAAAEWEDRQGFGAPDAATKLRVISSTDTAVFRSFLESFTSVFPQVSIDYAVAATADIDRFVRKDPSAFDIVISSAMDLQFKLANDGFARRIDGLDVPPWAMWRQSVFAFTSEPATIVINRAAFEGFQSPRTRQDLIRILRNNPDVFVSRVGTYDVRQSGLGYLFATQDARTSETFWRLMEVMGNLRSKLYCCSGDMIEDVAKGDIAVAYNVLGSYAAARADLSEDIEIIVPQDFQTVMMRTALVLSETDHPDVAAEFLQYLVAVAGLSSSGVEIDLPMLDFTGPASAQSTIQLGPALLTYLDRLKSQRFFSEWEDAVIQ